MTVQDAIYILNGFNLRNNADKYDLEALNLGAEALEKQIPKKPKDIGHYVEIYICPRCESNIVLKPNYCEKCGQALDWSVEE